MSRIIRVIIQNSLHQNKNREEVKSREIRYLSDLFIVNLLSVFDLVQRILNIYPNYLTNCLYFGEVKAPYSKIGNTLFAFASEDARLTEKSDQSHCAKTANLITVIYLNYLHI